MSAFNLILISHPQHLAVSAFEYFSLFYLNHFRLFKYFEVDLNTSIRPESFR